MKRCQTFPGKGGGSRALTERLSNENTKGEQQGDRREGTERNGRVATQLQLIIDAIKAVRQHNPRNRRGKGFRFSD